MIKLVKMFNILSMDANIFSSEILWLPVAWRASQTPRTPWRAVIHLTEVSTSRTAARTTPSLTPTQIGTWESKKINNWNNVICETNFTKHVLYVSKLCKKNKSSNRNMEVKLIFVQVEFGTLGCFFFFKCYLKTKLFFSKFHFGACKMSFYRLVNLTDLSLESNEVEMTSRDLYWPENILKLFKTKSHVRHVRFLL